MSEQSRANNREALIVLAIGIGVFLAGIGAVILMVVL